jgi:hypothetical protein
MPPEPPGTTPVGEPGAPPAIGGGSVPAADPPVPRPPDSGRLAPALAAASARGAGAGTWISVFSHAVASNACPMPLTIACLNAAAFG